MKNRKYRWQPELAVSIIYWSLTMIVLFYSLTLSLENTRPYWKSNLVMVFFFVCVIIGCLRRFVLFKDYLLIFYARFWKKQKFYYANITRIAILPNGIEFLYLGEEYSFLMRKKTKKAFLNELKTYLPAEKFVTKDTNLFE
ncbi:MAG: EbsA family protein [Enterococcus canintestini]|uniref:EbsA family protein n=1 Tax=Enterococcus TaxID=1350 RepID=UPI00399331A8